MPISVSLIAKKGSIFDDNIVSQSSTRSTSWSRRLPRVRVAHALGVCRKGAAPGSKNVLIGDTRRTEKTRRNVGDRGVAGSAVASTSFNGLAHACSSTRNVPPSRAFDTPTGRRHHSAHNRAMSR